MRISWTNFWLALIWWTLLCFFFTMAVKAQTTKKPKYYTKDTTWIEVRRDTIHGEISYSVENGTIKGSGIIVRQKTTQWRKWLDPEPPVAYKTGVSFISFGRDSQTGITHWEPEIAYIKTKDGYLSVWGKYVFIPD